MSLQLQMKYKEVFGKFDLLLTPTLPWVAPKILKEDPEALGEYIRMAFGMTGNTVPYNLLGNPAMTLN
ncbi:MAG: hypothetical protein GY786_19345 [Proteobacteria bacterium]|nr:hypothetical protein [Pseudomonadota bacterium]